MRRKEHVDGKKHCVSCDSWKSASEYHRNKRNWDGLHAFCKGCMSASARKRFEANREKILNQSREYQAKHPERRRNTRLKARFGMSHEDYTAMYERQNGRCLICKEEHELLRIDHDHVTKRIRGLLCHHCNSGLGLFRDRQDLLIAAVEYLKCK